jgi:hypothetical protein
MAAGRYIPLVVENVRGAQRFVGRAKWHHGSFYLWGDVPALMPMRRSIKNDGGSWFNIAHNTTSGKGQNPVSGFGSPGYKAVAFNSTAEQRLREAGVKFATKTATSDYGRSKGRSNALRAYDELRDHQESGIKQGGSKARKAASALIAKIPLSLSRHIARAWYPIMSPQEDAVVGL